MKNFITILLIAIGPCLLSAQLQAQNANILSSKSVLAGDSNCDGTVNVIDVITTTDFILGNNPQPFCFDNADVNGDGSVNAIDVIGIINIILGGGFVCGNSTITDIDGNVYNTILIGDQCWMKESLKVGIMINGIQEMSNNGLIEKYCYNDEPSNCDIYGGLYQWDEMMAYSVLEGAQGICPSGWHIPTDEEWKMLEGEVDSQYNYPDPVWDFSGWRGFDASTNLKSTSGWTGDGSGTDLYGFSANPGGRRYENGSFLGGNNYGGWWTSSGGAGAPTHRGLHFQQGGIFRGPSDKPNGRSVRCLMND